MPSLRPLALCVLLTACSSPGGDGTPVGDTVIADTTADAGADGTSDAAPDATADTTPDTTADAGDDATTGMACPRVDLGSALPAVYQGSTDGLTDLFTSQRLEWEEAPDDALLFTAPETGDYWIELVSSDNQSLFASAEKYTGTSTVHDRFTPADCPSPGSVAEVDGFYGPEEDYPLPLQAGDELLILVSTPYWAAEPTGSYTLSVYKL